MALGVPPVEDYRNSIDTASLWKHTGSAKPTYTELAMGAV
jgi:hypothetical protein